MELDDLSQDMPEKEQNMKKIGENAIDKEM
jgi:hypothetical protein